MALEEKVKEIITFCPHYYDIINTNFSNDDVLTKKLVKEFSEEIFDVDSNNFGTVNRLKVIDYVINEYLSKQEFHRFTKEYIYNTSNAIDIEYDNLLYSLIDIFKIYVLEKARKNEEESSESRWI